MKASTVLERVRLRMQESKEATMPRKISMIAAALGATMLAAAPAHAAGVKVGTLTCDVEAGWGYVLGSQKDLSCVFKSATNNTVAKYTGDITKLGVDIGYTNAGVLVWTVVAPSKDMQADALEGSYGGVTAGATAVVGGNLNILVGGLDKSITLQPLSVEGNTGVSVTAAVGAMQLRYEKV
jgi:hypothetical protein